MSNPVNKPTELTKEQQKFLSVVLQQTAKNSTIMPGAPTTRATAALDPYGRIVIVVNPTSTDGGILKDHAERPRFDLMVEVLNHTIPGIMADYDVEKDLPNVAFSGLDVVTMRKDDVNAIGTFIDAISNQIAKLDPDWDVEKDGDGQSWLEQHMPEFMGTHGRVFDLEGGLIYPGSCYKKDDGDED